MATRWLVHTTRSSPLSSVHPCRPSRHDKAGQGMNVAAESSQQSNAIAALLLTQITADTEDRNLQEL